MQNETPRMITIEKIAYYLPEKVLTNEMLEQEFPDWSSDKIAEKVGIKQRHIVSEGETSLNLAIKASENLFEEFDKQKIDFILYCTQSPDYFLPTTACVLQDKLGLKPSVGALDFNLGCSGFVYGLAMAKGLIAANIAKCILLVTTETYSKHIHQSDKGNRSIFGDGAAVSVISKDTENGFDFEFTLGTDGSGFDNLIVKNGAFRHKIPCELENILEDEFISDDYLYMNGPEIFNFTIASIPPLVNENLEKNNLSLEDIDFVIFHQANKYMLEFLRRKTKIPEEKFYINMESTGNTVSATIPIAIQQCLESGKLKKGNRVLIAGFGVGYSWGATIITI